MTGLGELDRPGTPGSPGAWDARSEEWVVSDLSDLGNGESPALVSDGTGGGTGERTADGRTAYDPRSATDRDARLPAADDRFEAGAADTWEAPAGHLAAGVEAFDGRATARTEAFDGHSAIGMEAFDGHSATSAEAFDRRLATSTEAASEGRLASGAGAFDGRAPAGAGAFDDRSATGAEARDGRLATDAEAFVGGSATDADLSHTRPATDAAPSGARPAAGRRSGPSRRGGADPVKALMHRHRELCERAVDPLEIAAGLEAHGVTDRTAARFRHRDVFSLAEEMYARVPRDDGTAPRPQATPALRARADWALLALLPGALCAAAVTGLRLTHGQARLTVALVGALAVALGVRAALSRGPLSTPSGTHAWRTPPGTRAWTCWLLVYALLGDGLLRAVADGGPDALPTGTADGPWPLATAPVLALTLTCAPAAWCAHLFAARARRRLAASRGLEEFASSAQPLLLGTFALFLCALTTLLALCGAALGEPAAYAQALTLGALLLLARLLTAHGFTHVPTLVLATTATAEATSLALVFTGRLPGCAFLATPVETLVDSWGPGSIPALVCGAAALTLLVHATRTLTRASAHAPAGEPR
jgi:hypothetical protein